MIIKNPLLTYLVSIIVAVFFLWPTNIIAGESSHSDNEEFNPGKMILHHVLDSHEWHVMDIGEKSVTIPLPIIIYSKKRGLFCFSSKNFNHGHSSYKGFYYNHGHIETLDKNESIYDLSITKNVFAMLLCMFIMLWVFISIARIYTNNQNQAPKGLQSFLEPIIIFVRDDIAKPSIGEEKYSKHMPFLLTVFFFIWISNMLGLIPFFPGGANVTGNIAVPLVLAMFTFVITLLNSNKYYWSHIFNPPVPLGVKFILVPIEILGVLTKPLVLILRLFANITAGHIVILSFISLIFIFGNIGGIIAGYSASIVSVGFAIFTGLLEILVAFLQAFVFTLLSAIYFGMAQEEHH